ncbi:MAG: helix-turn-helix domain-containing protein [Chloroflexota bacterium]|nr:helix-turn-helix domain-containing protein [Chloroflexota bacterium]
MRTKSLPFTRGSDNIFADLGFEDADELLLKSQLARRITKVIRDRGLSRAEAANHFGIDQARISDIMNGRLDRFSLDRL